MVFKVIHEWLFPMSRFMWADLECEAFRKHKRQISWSLILGSKENRVEIEALVVIGAAEEMMGLMVVWKHDFTAEPLGTGKFLLPGPVQTCLVQNSGTGSTGHLFGFNSAGDRIVQARLGLLPTDSMREQPVLSWRSKRGQSPGWALYSGGKTLRPEIRNQVILQPKKKAEVASPRMLVFPPWQLWKCLTRKSETPMPRTLLPLVFSWSVRTWSPWVLSQRERTWRQGAGQCNVSALSRGTSGHPSPPFAAHTINPCMGSGATGTQKSQKHGLWGKRWVQKKNAPCDKNRNDSKTGFLTMWHSFQQMWWLSH